MLTRAPTSSCTRSPGRRQIACARAALLRSVSAAAHCFSRRASQPARPILASARASAMLVTPLCRAAQHFDGDQPTVCFDECFKDPECHGFVTYQNTCYFR
eukprot:1785851-Prymnesium_polylepis.1